MQQFLFNIPSINMPIYGYGFMLFLAFIACSWLAAWRAETEGVARSHIHDVVIWLFLGGIFGARVTYMIFEKERVPLSQFFVIWKGGLIFYGSFFCGIISPRVWRAVQEGRDVLQENRGRLVRWIVCGIVLGMVCIAVREAALIKVVDPEKGRVLQAWRRLTTNDEGGFTLNGLAFGAALGGLVAF